MRTEKQGIHDCLVPRQQASGYQVVRIASCERGVTSFPSPVLHRHACDALALYHILFLPQLFNPENGNLPSELDNALGGPCVLSFIRCLARRILTRSTARYARGGAITLGSQSRLRHQSLRESGLILLSCRRKSFPDSSQERQSHLTV